MAVLNSESYERLFAASRSFLADSIRAEPDPVAPEATDRLAARVEAIRLVGEQGSYVAVGPVGSGLCGIAAILLEQTAWAAQVAVESLHTLDDRRVRVRLRSRQDFPAKD